MNGYSIIHHDSMYKFIFLGCVESMYSDTVLGKTMVGIRQVSTGRTEVSSLAPAPHLSRLSLSLSLRTPSLASLFLPSSTSGDHSRFGIIGVFGRKPDHFNFNVPQLCSSNFGRSIRGF